MKIEGKLKLTDLLVTIENTQTTENFHKPIFRDIKTVYLISRAFLSILCVQDTTLKVLLKVINEPLLLLFKSGF